MTSRPQAKTTVGHLVYSDLPSLDLDRLMTDLGSSLSGPERQGQRLTWTNPGMALIDIGAARIVIGLARDIDSAGSAAMTVAVGYGPEADGDDRLAKRRGVLARLIAERVSARHAPLETVWTDIEESATPDLVDRCVQKVAARREEALAHKAERARNRRAMPRHFVEPADLPRLVARLDTTLAARWAGHGEGLLADGAAYLPPLDLSGPAGSAILAGDPAVAQPPASAPLRLAAHLIDAMLMIVALPVGAAMMTYSLSRGADLTTSARALAICCVAIGLLDQVGGTGHLGSMLSAGI